MNVFKSLPSTLLLLTIFSLGFSFSALALEEEEQARAGVKAATPSSQEKEEVTKELDISELRQKLNAVKDKQIKEKGAIDYDSSEYLEALRHIEEAKDYQLRRHGALGNVLDSRYQQKKKNEGDEKESPGS